MDGIRELLSRCAALLRRRKMDADLDDEVEAHLELAVAENVRRGMSPEEASRAALRTFGGVTQIKESYRSQRDFPFFAALGRDLRFAVRRVRKAPGFAAVVVVTLALGIGANTAIFTLVQGILLRSLPVSDPSRLYRIGDRTDCCYYATFENPDGDFDLFSYDLYQHFKQAAPEFEELAAVEAGGGGYSVRYGKAASKPLRSEFVSGNYFAALGVGAYAGRPFSAGDDRVGAAPVLVLSYSAWENDFARDPAIVGSTVYVQMHPYTVVGVAPAGFYGDRVAPIPPDFWLPISAEMELGGGNSAAKQQRTAWLYALGRLRPGVDRVRLQTKLSSVLRAWMAEWPDFGGPDHAAGLPRQHVVLTAAGGGIQKLQQQTGKSLRILMILSGVVLLISCANIANLLLARATTQRSEIAMRMALGAPRLRIVRQMITESVLLSLLGGLVGLAVAWLASQAMLALAFPEARHMPVQAHPSWPVLLFAFLVSLGTGLVFGTVPAWSSSHAQPADALRGTHAPGSDRGSLPQRMLVVFQLALCIVLLTGTFLMTKSLENLQRQNFGLDVAGRYTFQMDLEGAGYTLDRLPELYRRIEGRLGAIPGVANVSFARYIPLGGNQWGTCVSIQGRPDPGSEDKCFADWDRVSRQFLDSLGVPIVRGRGFTDQDNDSSVPVVVVNQAFAKRFFPGQDPIGKHIGHEGSQYAGAFEIVGVFADFMLQDTRSEVRPLLLHPLTQRFTGYREPAVDAAEKSSMFLNSIILNRPGSPGDLETTVRKALAEIDPALPVFRFLSYDAVVAGNFNQERLIARLTTAFGFVALLLATVGLYGVMSYFVARRTSEIGIRMAIGASRSLVVRMVMRRAMVQVVAGLAVGVPASLLLGRLVTSLLFHVRFYDPLALAGSVAVLGVCAAVAALIPAVRAASLDPVRALRSE